MRKSARGPFDWSRFQSAVPVLLLLLYVGQCLWFVATQSLTNDEPAHAFAGMEAVRDGRFDFLADQPPLARELFGIPLALSHAHIYWHEWLQMKGSTPSPEVIAWIGRPVSIILGVLLGILLWWTARSWFSTGAANLALGLFAFSPGMIAHFSIMAVDGLATLAVFGVALALASWWRVRGGGAAPWRWTAGLGALLGILLLSKFYAPPLFIVAIALILIRREGGCGKNPFAWNWRAALVVFLIAGTVVWAGYRFHVSRIDFDHGAATVHFPNRAAVSTVGYRGGDRHFAVPFQTNFSVWVPAAEYVEGAWLVKEHNRNGHPTFLLGRFSRMGWNLYYPIAMLLKWPLLVLLLALLGGGAVALRKVRLPEGAAIAFALPGLLFLMAVLTSSIQTGDRHVLPLYPFFLLLAAACWQGFALRRGLRLALCLIVLLNAADVLRYAPDDLSYFNIFVKSEDSWRLLADSNVDWGSGLIALRDYQRRHPEEELHVAYFGSVDPSAYGIRYIRTDEKERCTGTVVISAMSLNGLAFRDHDAYRWALQYPRVAILNHSLFVFKVPRQ